MNDGVLSSVCVNFLGTGFLRCLNNLKNLFLRTYLRHVCVTGSLRNFLRVLKHRFLRVLKEVLKFFRRVFKHRFLRVLKGS